MNKLLYIVCFLIFSGIYIEGSCIFDSDCNGNGLCDSGECVCSRRWGGSNCDYERKSQLVAFILQIFTGEAGGADFYTENYLIAGIKLGLFVFSIFGYILSFKTSCGPLIVRLLMVVAGVVCLLWWMIDNFRYGMNKVKDGHGMSLEPW